MRGMFCYVSVILEASSQEEQDNHLPEYPQSLTTPSVSHKTHKSNRVFFCLKWLISLHKHPWDLKYDQVQLKFLTYAICA